MILADEFPSGTEYLRKSVIRSSLGSIGNIGYLGTITVSGSFRSEYGRTYRGT